MKPVPLPTFASLCPHLVGLDELSAEDFPDVERAALLSFMKSAISETKVRAMRSRQEREEAA